MSFTALAWASKQSTGRASDKLVLYGLADRHNEEVDLAYPSVAWLCEFGDLNRKTVIAALARLEAAGIIADSGKRVGKTGQIKAYSLRIETVPKTEQSPKRNSSKKSRKESQKRDTEPVRNQCLSNDKHNSTQKPDDVSDEVWSDFTAHRKRKKANITTTAMNRIASEAKRAGWSMEDALAETVTRGWTSFKAEWVQPKSNDNNRGGSLADIGDEVRRMFNG